MRLDTQNRRHHRFNARAAVGASGGVYARILAIQMGVRGASFSAAPKFFDAGRILPLWTRDDTRMQRYDL